MMSLTSARSTSCASKMQRGSCAARSIRQLSLRVTCQAAAQPAHSRRNSLLFTAGLAWLAAKPALARQEQLTVCSGQDTAEEADACRQASLSTDVVSGDSYSAVAKRAAAAERPAGGVPVSVIDDAYSQATTALAETLGAYFAMDVYDKARVPLIKTLKVESNAWVSKYARGGSVRKLSARRMYVAVDAVQGHLASAGLAPFPKAKQATVNTTISEALAFLEKGQ